MTPVRAALACLVLLPGIAGAWPSWTSGEGPKGGFLANIGTQCEDLSAEPITYGMQYSLPDTGLPGTPIDVHDIWLAGGCVGCHNATAMGELRLDFEPAGGYQVVNRSSYRNAAIRLVQPGDPESSLFYTMLNCVPPSPYPLMPPSSEPVPIRISRSLRAMLFDWIEQGARGFDADGNPYSDVLFRDQLESQRRQNACMSLSPPPAPDCTKLVTP